MSFKKRAYLGHVCAVISILIWGSTFISMKVLLAIWNPAEILFYRFLTGYLFLWILKPRYLKLSGRMEAAFALSGLTGICLNCLLENTALLFTGASVVSVIVSASPFAVGILARIFFKQPLRKSFAAGFMIAMAGVICICISGENDFSVRLTGVLISLGACFVWAAYGIFSERINGQGFDAILVTRRLFFYGTLFTLPLYLYFRGEGGAADFLKPQYLGNLLYLGIGACAIAYVTWNYAIGALGTVCANAYVYFLPAVTILFSVLFLHEKMTWLKAAGMALVLAGLILSEYKNKKESGSGLPEPPKNHQEKEEHYADYRKN